MNSFFPDRALKPFDILNFVQHEEFDSQHDAPFRRHLLE